jgi:ActR/RegA family two-component response regulator
MKESVMAGRKPVVLLVEGNAMLRGAVARRLSQRLPVAVREASSGVSAVILARQLKPAVVVLNMSLPDQSGLAAISELRMAWPETTVIALASHPDAEYVAAARRAGAATCLPRERMAVWIEPVVTRALPVASLGWLAWPRLAREALARSTEQVSRWAWRQAGADRVSVFVGWLDRHGPWQDRPRTRLLYAANVMGVVVMSVVAPSGMIG